MLASTVKSRRSRGTRRDEKQHQIGFEGKAPGVKPSRIVYVSRDPLIHQIGGSTTYARGLIATLRGAGADVRIVTTSAYSCSPLLWFRNIAAMPPGVRFSAPGFLRIGSLYLNLFSPIAWARAASRLSSRFKPLKPLLNPITRIFGKGLYTNAWDLTPPTRREQAAALREIGRADPTTVIVNYDIWAPLLQQLAASGRKRVIVMHDLLSARTQSFLQTATPLDTPVINEAEEMSWLCTADVVLAAQSREAEYIRTKIDVPVLVAPLPYRATRLPGKPEVGRCLFVGANIAPNQTGLRWFIDDVWPRVRSAHPGATLAVIGRICASLEDGIPGVLKLNTVPSMEGEYARASVCVVPLRIGSGIKIKLVEALSFGKAVVSTHTGVQGVESWAPKVVDVTDDAERFAAAIITLLKDDAARQAREQAAVAAFEEHLAREAALTAELIGRVL